MPPTTSANGPSPRPGPSPTPSSPSKITAIHAESKGTYGSPRVHRALRERGVGCGQRRVRRLMRQAGLEGRCKKRWRKTTVADPDADEALDLIQRAFGPGAEIDRRYVGDITYIATWEGWSYLATVIDLSSTAGRRVGARRPHAHRACLRCADHGVRNRSPEEGLIFHSDRGCQYTSADYGELARTTASCSRSGARASAGTTP